MKSYLSSNLFSMAASQITSAIISFFSLSLTARYLGKEEFGIFSYYLSLSIIIVKFLDFGFAPIIFRELSKDKNEYGLFNAAITFRTLNIIICLIAIFIYFYAFESDHLALAALIFFILSNVLSSKAYFIRELLEIPFKVNYKMKYAAFFQILDNLIYLISIIILSQIKAGIISVIAAYSLSNLFGFIFTAYMGKRLLKVKYYFTLKKIIFLLKESYPVYIYALLETAFMQLDYIMLKSLSNNSAIGSYSAAARLTAPLLIFPAAIVHTFFPILSSDKLKANIDNVSLPQFLTKIITCYGFSLLILFAIFGKFATILAFGKDFTSAANVAFVLLIAQSFLFLNYYFANLMVALERQKFNMYYSLIIIIANIFMNFYTISKYNELGASFSKLIVAYIGLLFFFFFNRKEFDNFKALTLNQIITISIFPIFLSLFYYLNCFILSFSILCVFFLILIFSNIFSPEEKILIKKIIRFRT